MYLKLSILRYFLFSRIWHEYYQKTPSIFTSGWLPCPLQDFTTDSDIDWSKPISEIDRQLYAKYDLDEKEIAFIESHVKAME